jgi:hypothetical protein
LKLTTKTLARCTVSKNMHKKPQPPSLIIYFLILKKSLGIPFKYCNTVFNVIGLTVLPSDMSSYYDHVYKIEELNYKEGW